MTTHDLPWVGAEYVFFLTIKGQSPNYEILICYELKEKSIIPLDRGRNFDEFKEMRKQNFLEEIRR